MHNRQDIRVLVAENNHLIGQLVQGQLSKLGYEVAGQAVDGLEAVKMAKEVKPDAIIMDIDMPEINGIEATRQIFNDCPIPVVMLTAYGSTELVEQASEAGAGAYLVKPANTPELDRAITIAMARFKDMMTLRDMNSTLQTLNDELKLQNEELDSFAHTVAHDLKNPLHLIVSYCELLKMQVKLEGRLENAFDVMKQTGHKMATIIDELMLLASLRKADLELQPLDMDEIIEEVLQRLAHMIGNYEPEFVGPDEWPAALGYGPWVEEIWANYISNAMKYGGEPPRVEFGATDLENGKIKFWVQDNGQGLTPEQQDQLFTPFNRLNEKRAEGHGLGLSIVQRIVEKLDGEVGVESTVGEGSRFSFILAATAPEN